MSASFLEIFYFCACLVWREISYFVNLFYLTEPGLGEILLGEFLCVFRKQKPQKERVKERKKGSLIVFIMGEKRVAYRIYRILVNLGT